MRVLLALPNDNDVGGVASVVRNLAKSLTERGHQVFFLHPASTIFLRPTATKSGFPGFGFRMQMPLGERHPVISLLAFLLFFPIGLYETIRLIRKLEIDVINIHYPAGCLFYLALCRRILGVRLVTSIHGADIFPDGTLQQRLSPALRFVLSSSDLIVAPSRNFQSMFARAFSELATKTTLVHNGVDFAEFDPHSAVEIDRPYLFCVSAYKQQKAIDVLIRAFKEVLAAEPTVKLIIVGPGPLRDEFEKLSVALGIGKQIELLGPKSRIEVVQLLRGCTAFVLPSRFETFGIVILEAMACKRPVVATTAGGIPEIVDSGKNGILVAPGDPNALADALVGLLRDESLQLRLAENGHLTARERFDFARTAENYERALGGAPAAENDFACEYDDRTGREKFLASARSDNH
jgi:glycosyltransferase involved in cell wall biosynthesis